MDDATITALRMAYAALGEMPSGSLGTQGRPYRAYVAVGREIEKATGEDADELEKRTPAFGDRTDGKHEGKLS